MAFGFLSLIRLVTMFPVIAFNWRAELLRIGVFEPTSLKKLLHRSKPMRRIARLRLE